jgi:hypothetical protein
MSQLHDPVVLIQQNLEAWGTPYVELDTFATDRAEQIVDLIDAFCLTYLGARLAGYLFYGSSVGSTHGVQLTDGRAVVIKARLPAHVNPNLKHDPHGLATICRVMKWLRARDYPCPEILLGPTPIGEGLATVEEYFAPGEYGDAFVPACRRTIASGFAELIALLRTYEGEVSSLQHFQRGAALYPQPHGKIFNFETTSAGAEWIDEFARRARQAEDHDGERVLGHADWRVEHLRFQDGRIVATYDWDSLASRTETELVGGSAHGFTADWTREGVRRIPTAEDICAYIADYEHSRGQFFTKRERRSVFASCVYWIAYGARCTHSLSPNTTEWKDDTWPYLLRTEGEALLAEARA